MKKFLRVTYYIGGTLLVLLVALIALSQTRLFKSYLRDLLLSESRSALLGTLSLGSIDGNLATGFIINGLSLQVDGQNVLATDRFEIQYDPLTMMLKRVVIPTATITNPHIFVYRSPDGTWNLSGIVKPTPSDTTPSSWKIEIKRVALVHAEITLVDSLAILERHRGLRVQPLQREVDYAHLSLHDVSLVASVYIDGNQQKVIISKLEAASSQPDFQLVQLKGEFFLSKNEVHINNMVVETRNSKVQFDMGISNVDVTHIHALEELEHKPVVLNLVAERLDTKELKQLLYPWIDFLDGDMKFQLKASGTFGDLHVERLSIEIPHSLIQIQGTISNLHHPSDLHLNLVANNNVVSSSDVLRCLPGLQLPDLSYLGEVHYSLAYNGAPTDFHAHLTGTSAVGSFDLGGKMKLQPRTPSYDITALVQNVALGSILKNDHLSSNLNARFALNGSGFNLRTMTAIGKLEIDSSSLNGLPIYHSVVVVDAADGSVSSHLSLSIGSTHGDLSGRVNYLSVDSLLYNYSGRLLSVDLAELLQEKTMESDLSFNVQGAGFVGAMNRRDTVGVQFLRSSYGRIPFDNGEAQFRYVAKNGGADSLHVTSSPADIDVAGKFTPSSFINGMSHTVQLIYDAIAYRAQTIDSVRSSNTENSVPHSFHSPLSSIPIDATFHIAVKDFSPIGSFLHSPMKGSGIFKGTIIGDSINTQLNGQFDVRRFGYRSDTDTLAASTLAVQYAFDGINNKTIFKTIKSSVQAQMQDALINSLVLNRASVQMSIFPDSLPFQIQMLIDSSVAIETGGVAQYVNNKYAVFLPHLQIGLGKCMEENSDTVKFNLGVDGFDICALTVSHESAEATITGLFNPKANSDLSYKMTNFFLTDLKEILRRTSYAESSTSFSGIVDLNGWFRGTLKRPNISVGIRADAVGIDRRESSNSSSSRTVVGRIAAHLGYADRLLDLDIRLHSQPENLLLPPDLLLTGSVPYDLALVSQPEQNLEGKMDLLLQTQHMNLAFLGPFVPELGNLIGTLQCDVKMKGDIDAPQYEGSMAIRDANFLFKPLDIKYSLNGDFVPAGDHIQLQNVVIQNMPEERHVGTMNVAGNLSLAGLQIKSFDLLMNGTLLVMKEENRIQGQSFYGNIFIATGQGGLKWKGNLLSSLVQGEVYTRDAQLILPPDRESQWTRASVVALSYIDDTTKVLPSTINADSDDAPNVSHATTGKPASKQAVAVHTPSFLDGINYDLAIETQGLTQLRFIFNTQTNEELSADLNGRITFNRMANVSRLTGQVEVTDRSYYNFLKKFQASGKLLFTGSLLNPELNVTATYEGTHRRDTTRGVYSALPTSSSQDAIGSTQKVVVTLIITGTRNEPKVKFGITQNDIPRETGEEESDAIAFLLSGQFRDELTDQQRTSLIGSNVGFGLASGMLTGPLSEALRRNTLGYVQSVDVLYYGGQFSSAADIRLTGQVGEAVYRIGGRVLNDPNNTNASVELPMSIITGSPQLRNLIFTLEHRVETLDMADEQRHTTNALRLLYRFSF